MTIVRGGASVAGVRIGILMLQTRFPRIPGDGGNASTWPFPILYKVVRNATPGRVVRERAHGLVDAFIDGARELVATGAGGIVTNCGFLSLYQKELAAACEVPVAASSLLQVPWVQALLPPGKRVGVLTISPDSLTPAHLEAAGAPADTPIGGTAPDTEFARVLLHDEDALDVSRAREEVVGAGRALLDTHADIGAIVLECTNMPPYAANLSATLGVPVYDFYSLVCWFHAGLAPRRFHGART